MNEDPNTMIELEITNRVVLSADEVWPDGDWPDKITAQDVSDRIEECANSALGLSHAWNLDDDAELEVWVEGERVQPWY